VAPYNILYSQDVQSKPTRQSSLEAFSQGSYEKAYAQFSELLKTYTKDPLYKYYSGVCLVKLNRDPVEATRLLQDAVFSTGTIKTLPSDGLFYLGRAQQLSGKYSDARISYNSYIGQVGKKTSREMGVPDLILQCNENKGQLTASEPKPSDIINNTKPDIIQPDPKPVAEVPVIKPAPIAVTEVPVMNPSPVAPVNKSNLPANYEKMLSDAIEFQIKADSVTSIAESLKKGLNKYPESERAAMKARIVEKEKEAAIYQAGADQKYREIDALNNKLDSSTLMSTTSGKSDNKVQPDTIIKPASLEIQPADKRPDAPKAINPPATKQQEIYSAFEVLSQPATDPKAKIIYNSQIPAGLVYRIQIGVMRNSVTPAYFKGLSPAYGFRVEGTENTVYYVGMFRKYSDASKALVTVKSKGFKDAFITALSANKRVTPDRSAQMEKEWGNKPLFHVDVVQIATKSDTIPPTLTFRVEVTRTLKPLKSDIVEEIKKMAGNRGLDIITLEDGKIDYLIGKFITFETASEYSDLLKRNGYRDAQVVAWLGMKEIPIETAKELFDKLK
jgi:hypothetical protein